jgi:hypothetical protein
MMLLTTNKPFLFFLFFATTNIADGKDLSHLPGIHIEREIDASENVQPALKSRYQQCVKLKRLNMKQYNEQPDFWKITSTALSPEYVKNIKANPSNDPAWADEKIGFSRKKEYFYNNQYVFIHEYFDYTYTQDGLCTLLKTKKEKRIIDTGKYVYHTNSRTAARKLVPGNTVDNPWMSSNPFIHSRTKKRTNAIASTSIANKELREAIKGNEDTLGRKLSALLQMPDSAKAPPSNTSTKNKHNSKQAAVSTQQLTQAMIETLALEKTPAPKNSHLSTTTSEHIAAGQACDWVKPKNLAARVCYWSTSHTYPSELSRPIILKKEYKNTREEATVFQRIDKIPKELLSPPPKI